jgi:hypothetical protein
MSYIGEEHKEYKLKFWCWHKFYPLRWNQEDGERLVIECYKCGGRKNIPNPNYKEEFKD